MFFVQGGVFRDAGTFQDLIPETAERHGPFETVDEAKKVWASRAWATVDDCHARYCIIEE